MEYNTLITATANRKRKLIRFEGVPDEVNVIDAHFLKPS
jgi:hypothetical protein